MSEHRVYPDHDVPPVATFEFHEHRDRAKHLEHPGHRPRMDRAALFADVAVRLGARSASDLGCGDGGLLSILPADLDAWGYDFCPANAAGWAERGVKAEALDVFGADRERVRFGDLTLMTEVLEHIADPHGALRWVHENSRFLIASSPWCETPEQHDECHAWLWDQVGYRYMIESAGYRVLHHDAVGGFQVIMAWRP